MISEAIVLNDNNIRQPDLTYKINFDKEKLTEKIDKLEAVKQAVFLILSTQRDYSPVYKDYGIKTIDLIGKDFYYAISELKRRIKEALLQDDRIRDVDNFMFEQRSDELLMKFDVVCIYGGFKAEGGFRIGSEL